MRHIVAMEYNNTTFQPYDFSEQMAGVLIPANSGGSDSSPASSLHAGRELLEDVMLITRAISDNRELLARLA